MKLFPTKFGFFFMAMAFAVEVIFAESGNVSTMHSYSPGILI